MSNRKIDAVRDCNGAFTKFYALSYGSHTTEWDLVALSYLGERNEMASGMSPGYITRGNQIILGFKSGDGLFVT